MTSKTKQLIAPLSAFLIVVLLISYVQARPPKIASAGIAVDHMGLSVVPGNDFYAYANGAWIKRAEIPADHASVNIFSLLSDLTDERTAALIKGIVKSAGPAGSSTRQIADLYNSFMAESEIEARGLKPLEPHFAAIRAVSNKKELAHVLGETLRADVDPLNNTNFHTPNLFGLWTAPGFNDSAHYAAYLLQGGLELPDREYYLSDTPQMRAIQSEYQNHIAIMLKLAGISDPAGRAARIFALEHSIAEKHVSLADDQDIHTANNTWKQADFATKAPGLDWSEYFRAAGLDKQEAFTVWQPTAFIAESALVDSVPLETWKDWLTYHLIEDYAPYLPKALANENFRIFDQMLSGTPEQRPRNKRGIDLVNDHLGDALGKIYARQYFSPQAKAQAEAMVAKIIAAFRKRIDALDWMAAATKAEARSKLGALYVGIGYPESWHDYSGFQVKADDLFGNVWRGRLFEFHRQVNRLGTNVNRREWSMSPQTVNAVNLPLQNALNFPAAILQPPFYNPKAPAAFNYGAIGAVIGHEISHTFDSEGAAFDAQGRLRNWWTDADLSHFNAATARLAAQYDAYKPFPDLSLNGKQTLAENIADLGGLSAALDGYHATLAGKPAPAQSGFSGDQQFFLAFAQSWGSKVREATLRRQVMTDSHSPGEYRTATVRNLDAWYPAFDVKPGQALFLPPPDRIRIW